MNIFGLPRLLPALFMSVVGAAVAKETDTSPVPPVPQYDQFSLIGLERTLLGTDGSVTWIAADFGKAKAQDIRCGFYPTVKRTWVPAAGTTQETPLGLGADGLGAQLATPAGILLVTSSSRFQTSSAGTNCVALVQPNNAVVTARMAQKFVQPRLALLADGSVAVLERDETTRHIRVDIVQLRSNQLSIEQMPPLAIPYRNDFQQAALPDGRLMVLGGSDAQYRGCSPCRAETQVLDPKTKTWSAGPSMREARSEHLATRLPDGSILVTGGWTPTHGWGHGPARTAERWNPATNKFEAIAPMPSGTSRHRAIWMPGQEGKTLLIAGGNNSSVHAYDVRTGEWTTAGATRQGSEEGGCAFVPFVLAGQTYAWTVNNTEGHYSSKSCGSQRDWELIALRTANVPALPAPEKFLATYRSQAALVPATGDKPALVIGGSIHAGMNSYLATSAVEAIDAHGAVRSLPSLNETRHGTLALRVGEGVLVMGGRGEDSDKTARDYGGPPLTSMEWLVSDAPGSNARWIRLGNQGFSHGSFEQLPDGSLLVFSDGVNVNHFTFVPGNGGAPSLSESTNTYPPLNRARRSVGSAAVKVRTLPDGRLVVAAGHVQAEKIALYRENTKQADARDEYLGIGEFRPSRRHEIYEPATGRWRTSAPARGAGGKVAILPDGRVLKIGRLPGKDENDEHYAMEISNADGTAWTTWPTESLPKMKMSGKANPFVVDGELFLSGELGSLSTGGGPSGLEWFNAASGRWEVLWWADTYDNWRDHVGRLIVRQLANGKKVILPVDGH